jgi:hypothetical protein
VTEVKEKDSVARETYRPNQMPGTVEHVNQHREAAKFFDIAGASHPPPHTSFVAANNKIRPAHQGVSINGHPRSILVTQEGAVPAGAFSSSENFSDYILPSVSAIEELLLRVKFSFQYTDSDATNNAARLHQSYAMIDRCEIHLTNSSTADLVITGEEMFLQYLFSIDQREKSIDSHEHGFDNDINGELKESDLVAEISDLAKATSKVVERTFALRTQLDQARLATKYLTNQVRIRIYWSAEPPVTIAKADNSSTVSATASLQQADLIVVHSEVDHETDVEIGKLYSSSQGVHYGCWATTKSEKTQASGTTGSEVQETLPQHVSAGNFALLVYWTDTASTQGFNVGSGGATEKMTNFPHNVLKGNNLADGSIELEDPNNKNIYRKETFAYHQVQSFKHTGFAGERSGYDGFIWLPMSYSVQDALAHGARTGSLAFDDGGRTRLRYIRSTAHNNTATQTLHIMSWCYAELSIRNGIPTYQRL